MEHLGLEEDQLAKLKQFTEVTNVNDLDVAVGTLASLDWNIERAIEAHLMQDMDDGNDDPEIIEPQQLNALQQQQQQQQPAVFGSNGRRAVGVSRRRGGPDDDVDNQIDDDVHMADNNEPVQQRQTRQTRSSARLAASSSAGSSAASSSSIPSSRSTRATRGGHSSRPTRATNNPNNVVTIDSDDDEEMRVDYDDDDYGEVAQEAVQQIRARNGLVPLIPENCDDVSEGLHNFVAVFEGRFCSKPPTCAFMPHFYTEALPMAIKDAFDQPDCSSRRPLALYIHTEKSIASNIFASQVLCTEAISTLLRHQYIFWPWDITMASNLRKLLEWLQILNIGEVRQFIQRWSDTNIEAFPLIAIVVREKGTFRLVEACRGTETADQVVEKLMRGVEEYENIRVTEVNEKREREAREALRNEQEAEYHASLAADRARIEAKNREIEEQRLEEERRQKAEEDEAMRRQMVASMLPNEPSATETEVVQVKFRLPEGGQDMRRFRKSEALETLINYLSSKGYAPESYKYFNSDFPKKEITAHFDLTKSFGDLKWPAREQVFVDEI